MNPADFLQWGAMGVLSIVLIGIGTGLFWYVRAQHNSQQASEKWTRDLVVSTLKLHQKGIDIQQQIMVALGQISDRIEEESGRSAERHGQILTAIAGNRLRGKE